MGAHPEMVRAVDGHLDLRRREELLRHRRRRATAWAAVVPLLTAAVSLWLVAVGVLALSGH